MNKSEFVDYVADKMGSNKKEAEKCIDAFTSSVTDALGEGKEVNLIGFGSYSVAHVEARKGRNPRTGEEIQISAHKQPKFKFGKGVKDACNK